MVLVFLSLKKREEFSWGEAERVYSARYIFPVLISEVADFARENGGYSVDPRT